LKGLRILINLEPIGSKIVANQVQGRLREYSPTDDTLYFYPVDTTLEQPLTLLKRILFFNLFYFTDLSMIISFL